MHNRPIQLENTKVTRAERVRLLLADEIVAGKLCPGTRLDEVEQARRFGVSRTPVREAFRELAALGLVENRPHRGVIVTSSARAPASELQEACCELLTLCARLAAARDGGAPLDPDGDDDAVRQIAAAAGNVVLCETVLGLWRRVKPLLRPDPRLAEAARAVGGRDGDTAAGLIRAALRPEA